MAQSQVKKVYSKTEKEAEPSGSEKVQKKGEALRSEMDALLDDIDDVLEVNAETFIRAFVQKGGE